MPPCDDRKGTFLLRRILMTTTFMNSAHYLFTSESVTEGHPDKLCDQVSDAVLDACMEQDPMSRVACETATKTGFVMVLGTMIKKVSACSLTRFPRCTRSA